MDASFDACSTLIAPRPDRRSPEPKVTISACRTRPVDRSGVGRHPRPRRRRLTLRRTVFAGDVAQWGGLPSSAQWGGGCRQRSPRQWVRLEGKLLLEQPGAGAPARQDPDPFDGIHGELVAIAAANETAASGPFEVQREGDAVDGGPFCDH